MSLTPEALANAHVLVAINQGREELVTQGLSADTIDFLASLALATGNLCYVTLFSLGRMDIDGFVRRCQELGLDRIGQEYLTDLKTHITIIPKQDH